MINKKSTDLMFEFENKQQSLMKVLYYGIVTNIKPIYNPWSVVIWVFLYFKIYYHEKFMTSNLISIMFCSTSFVFHYSIMSSFSPYLKINMNKQKFISELSNWLIRDKFQEWLNIKEVLAYFKTLKPQNRIEERAIQRSVCVLYWYIMMQTGSFSNRKLADLLSYLQK